MTSATNIVTNRIAKPRSVPLYILKMVNPGIMVTERTTKAHATTHQVSYILTISAHLDAGSVLPK